MKCPTCVAENQASSVFVDPCSFTTAMNAQEFYDEQGKHHLHNPNRRTQGYSCSRGHRWSETSTPKCWCGWPDRTGDQ